MSSFTTGAWRRPRYLVTELTALLANEVLGAGDPHGPGQHSNRSLPDILGAELFSGTKTTFAIHSVITLTNAASVVPSGSVRIPKGAVSLDNLQLIIGQPAGVVAAGNMRLALGAKIFIPTGFSSDAASPGATLTLQTVAISAAGASDILWLISLPVLSLPANLDGSLLQIRAQRDATDVLDTYEGDLHFVGILATWTMDQ